MTDQYVRHRPRMVQESFFEDLTNTLIACRWAEGTTTRPVVNPANGLTEIVTTASSTVFQLADGKPLKLVDYFPDGPDTPEINTFAVAPPVAGDYDMLEMGSGLREQPYLISMALYASSDALAGAVFSDLKDRYEGRIVANEAIPLYDYLVDANVVVTYMDIEAFRFTRDPDMVSGDGMQLYFAEIELVDYT